MELTDDGAIKVIIPNISLVKLLVSKSTLLSDDYVLI